MNSWFRFGQPIGSALITAAILDLILNTYWLLLQYCNLESNNFTKFFQGSTEDFDFYGNLGWNFLICLRPLLSIVLWSGVIFWGKQSLLIVWLILSVLNDISLLSTVIYLYVYTDIQPQASTWLGIELPSLWPLALSIVVFILFRTYILLVGIQGVVRIHTKYDHSRSRSESDDTSDIDICLEPISFGFFQTWEFYKDLPGMGVIILLTVELIWNVLQLTCRGLTASTVGLYMGHDLPLIESNANAVVYIMFEENAMRCARIFLTFAGLVFVKKEKLNFVRLWICIYLLAFICSNVIFGVFVAAWEWGKIGLVNWIIFYSFYITSDNLFRIIVLYFSCKFAVVHTRTIIKM